MSEAADLAAAPATLPPRARAVVLGGGVIGCSVAYHLAEAGFGEVLLLERDRLTSGTTWHAAGLMATFGSTSETSTRLRQYTRELYQRLEAAAGAATRLREGGGDAPPPARRPPRGGGGSRGAGASTGSGGVGGHEISAGDVAKLFP